MASDLEHSSGPAEQAVANDYDSFAAAFTERQQSWGRPKPKAA